jgi:hypothetical protein
MSRGRSRSRSPPAEPPPPPLPAEAPPLSGAYQFLANSKLLTDWDIGPVLRQVGQLWDCRMTIGQPKGITFGPDEVKTPCRQETCIYCKMTGRPCQKEAKNIAAYCIIAQAKTHGWFDKDWKIVEFRSKEGKS